MLLNSSVDGKYEMRSLHVRYRGYRISSRQGAGLLKRDESFEVSCHEVSHVERYAKGGT